MPPRKPKPQAPPIEPSETEVLACFAQQLADYLQMSQPWTGPSEVWTTETNPLDANRHTLTRTAIGDPEPVLNFDLHYADDNGRRHAVLAANWPEPSLAMYAPKERSGRSPQPRPMPARQLWDLNRDYLRTAKGLRDSLIGPTKHMIEFARCKQTGQPVPHRNQFVYLDPDYKYVSPYHHGPAGDDDDEPTPGEPPHAEAFDADAGEHETSGAHFGPFVEAMMTGNPPDPALEAKYAELANAAQPEPQTATVTIIPAVSDPDLNKPQKKGRAKPTRAVKITVAPQAEAA